MSIEIMTKIWKIQELSSTQKLVALALADSANDHGMCYPSVTTIAKKCSLTDRGIRKILAQLEEIKLLNKSHRDGKSTVYFVSTDPVFLPKNDDFLSQNPGTTFSPEQGSPLNHVPLTPERGSATPERGSATPEPRSAINIKKHKETKGTQKLSDVLQILFEFGVVGELAGDFVAHRKNLKAIITRTAMQGFEREAVKAGLTTAEAVAISITNGWRGFNADWLRPNNRGQPFGVSKIDTLMQNNIAASLEFLHD